MSSRRPGPMALAGLLLLASFLFRGAVFGSGALYERDLGFWYYSQVESIVRIVTSGSWPLWDPYMAFGVPLLANPSTQILYPWTPLHLLLEPWTFYTFYVVSHLVFTGAGQYLLARRLELSPLASFVAASAWAASGPLLSMVNMWHHFSGAAWIPWLLLAAERARTTQRARDALLWGAVIAGQVLAGSADMCAIGALATLPAVLRPIAREPEGGRASLRWFKSVALAWGFAAALSAAQWLPALELIRGTQRVGLPELARTDWSLHPLALLQTAVPVATRGLLLELGDPRLEQELAFPLLHSLYLGVGALGLAASGLAGRRRPLRWFFAMLLAAALLVSLGRHAFFYGWLVTLLPPLAIVRFPQKAIVLAPFACGVLAGMGLDEWRRADPETPAATRWGLAFSVSLAALCVVVAAAAWAAAEGRLALPIRGEGSVPELLATHSRHVLMAGAAAGLLAWLARGRVHSRAHWAAGIVVVDLALAHASVNPTAPRSLLAQRPATVAAIAADGAQPMSRVYTFDYFSSVLGKRYPEPQVRAALDVPSANEPRGLARVLGLRMLYPASGRWALASSFDRDNLGLSPPHVRALVAALRTSEETPHHARLLAMASVGYVLSLHAEGLEGLTEIASVPSPFGLPIRVFRVPDPVPRVYAVGRARVLPPDALVTAALTESGFDPRREVLLTEGPVVDSERFAGTVRVREMKADKLVVEADLAAPGYVVLTDSYAPGWRASVDGQPAEVLRANIAFRAVRVPAGRHVVEQVYRPFGVRAGAVLSAITLLAGLAGFAMRAREATAPA